MLVADLRRHGNEGLGKPEPHEYDVAGYRSRRADEHRLVHQVPDDEVRMAACRHHHGR